MKNPTTMFAAVALLSLVPSLSFAQTTQEPMGEVVVSAPEMVTTTAPAPVPQEVQAPQQPIVVQQPAIPQETLSHADTAAMATYNGQQPPERPVMVTTATVLPGPTQTWMPMTDSAAPVAPPSRRSSLLRTGLGLFFSAYGVSALGGTVSMMMGSPAGALFLLPVVPQIVGGIMMLATPQPACAGLVCGPTFSINGPMGALLLLDGAVQIAGIATMIASAFAPDAAHATQQRATNDRRIQWSITPGAPSAMGGVSLTMTHF